MPSRAHKSREVVVSVSQSQSSHLFCVLSSEHKSGEVVVIRSQSHISRLFYVLSSHAEMSKIYSYWRERPQRLTHPSPEASSRSPGSENDIS